MTRFMAVVLAGVTILGAERAWAQETTPRAGTVEVTLIPGGATFFTSGDQETSFGGYNVGAALAYNINRFVGIEGEVGGNVGVSQDLQVGGVTTNQKSPNQLNYSGNLVLSAPTRSGVVPFVAGGIGGLTQFDNDRLGISRSETFLTGNVGGGLKWFAPNGRWGLRGDYRFLAVQSKDDAPAFFGQETRYGHRVYAGLVINAVR